MKDRYEFALNTVKKAGEMVLELRKNFLEVNTKNGDDRDLVTNVDLEVNEWIKKEIELSLPGDQVYSEESKDVGDRSESLWSVDPIDGTSNFSRDIPHFAVVMTYVEKGEVVLGVVYNPVTREMFSFKKDEKVKLNNEPVKVSSVSSIKDAYVLMHIGRKEEVKDWGLRLQSHFLSKAKKNINLSSSALDLAFLASGRVDVVIYGTMTTLDIATAIAMVREAGGEVYDILGNPIILSDKPQQIIATATKDLFDEISKI
jgi:myo-inositol-1(or 4)-monophosphatase